MDFDHLLWLPAAPGAPGPYAEHWHPWTSPVSEAEQAAAAGDTSAPAGATTRACQAAGAFGELPWPPLESCDGPCEQDLLKLCTSSPDDMDDMSDPFCMPI